MIIRKYASGLRFFSYLVRRSVTPAVAGQAEGSLIIKFDVF